MLGEPIGVYKFEEKFTEPSTTTKIFEGPAVRKNTMVMLTHGSVIDYTTANKKLLLGRKDGGGEMVYIRALQETNTFEAVLSGDMILLPGEKPIGVVETPTAGNVLYCSFYGLVFRLK